MWRLEIYGSTISLVVYRFLSFKPRSLVTSIFKQIILSIFKREVLSIFSITEGVRTPKEFILSNRIINKVGI